MGRVRGSCMYTTQIIGEFYSLAVFWECLKYNQAFFLVATIPNPQAGKENEKENAKRRKRKRERKKKTTNEKKKEGKERESGRLFIQYHRESKTCRMDNR